MGFGTAFNTEIYLNRMIFKQKWEVEEKIEQNKKYISSQLLDIFHEFCSKTITE